MTTHVAQVSTVHGWQDNRVFRRHSRTLARHGYRVTLLATGDGPTTSVDGVEVRKHSRSVGRVRRLVLDLPRTVVEALRLDADIYHVHDPELALVLPLLRRRGAVVYDAHEDLPAQVLAKSYLPGPVRALAPALARLLLRGINRSADHVVAATPTVAARFDPAHTTVVHNYPELLPAPAPPYCERSPTAVYVGRVSVSRGALDMLDGFRAAQLDEPWRLRVVGPAASNDLRSAMRAHPVASRVDDLGALPPLEARASMDDARIGLAVLQATPAYVDALPTKLFEYMAAGIPVVASDFPAWRRIVESARCGVLVAPSRPDELADALRSLATDADAAEMGARGRHEVFTNYSWSAEEAHLLRAVQGAGARRHRRAARPDRLGGVRR